MLWTMSTIMRLPSGKCRVFQAIARIIANFAEFLCTSLFFAQFLPNVLQCSSKMYPQGATLITIKIETHTNAQWHRCSAQTIFTLVYHHLLTCMVSIHHKHAIFICYKTHFIKFNGCRSCMIHCPNSKRPREYADIILQVYPSQQSQTNFFSDGNVLFRFRELAEFCAERDLFHVIEARVYSKQSSADEQERSSPPGVPKNDDLRTL